MNEGSDSPQQSAFGSAYTLVSPESTSHSAWVIEVEGPSAPTPNMSWGFLRVAARMHTSI